MKKRFELADGNEVRGMMIKLYPSAEEDAALRQIEDDSRTVWNHLVKQTEDVLSARASLAVRDKLVPPRPERPDYDGMSPDDAKAARVSHRAAYGAWHASVHKATKDHPGCTFRTFRDELDHHGAKHDYQLFQRVISWKREREQESGCSPSSATRPCAVGAHVLQAIAKNYFQKSDRRKKFRRRQDAMPIQTRSGTCFELGEFGPRGRERKNFYDCRIRINGLKVRGRLPGRAPWGRVLEGVSVTRKADGWWASIKQEIPIRTVQPPVPGTMIGIDVGLVLIAATSDGLKIPNPRGAAYAERIAGRQAMGKPTERMQLRAARQVKHELYTKLLPAMVRFEVICVEKLQPKIGQMGSDKVSAMRLVKSMLVERYGDRVREVDCRYTSQDCSQCGHRDKESWSYAHGRYGKCNQCGYTEDRDVNAARNIATRPAISMAS